MEEVLEDQTNTLYFVSKCKKQKANKTQTKIDKTDLKQVRST